MSRNTDKLIDLHIAVAQNNKNAVIVLLKEEPELDINECHRGSSVLHMATTNNNSKMIHTLLAGGVDVNIQDEQGDIPLCIAKSPAAFQILLDSNADPNIKNSVGRSVMDMITNPQNDSERRIKEYHEQYQSDYLKNIKIPLDAFDQNVLASHSGMNKVEKSANLSGNNSLDSDSDIEA